MRSALVATVLVALVVVGCADPSPSVRPGLVATGTVEDPAGDQVDQGSRAPRGEPGFADLQALHAVADGTDLEITLVVAAEIPIAHAPTIERVSYNITVHTDADAIGANDRVRAGMGYLVEVSLTNPGQVRFSLAEWQGDNLIRQSFPAREAVAGDTYVVKIPLAALGDPVMIRLGVDAYATGPAGGDPAARSTTEDHLPDERPGDDQGWLTLGP